MNKVPKTEASVVAGQLKDIICTLVIAVGVSICLSFGSGYLIMQVIQRISFGMITCCCTSMNFVFVTSCLGTSIIGWSYLTALPDWFAKDSWFILGITLVTLGIALKTQKYTRYYLASKPAEAVEAESMELQQRLSPVDATGCKDLSVMPAGLAVLAADRLVSSVSHVDQRMPLMDELREQAKSWHVVPGPRGKLRLEDSRKLSNMMRTVANIHYNHVAGEKETIETFISHKMHEVSSMAMDTFGRRIRAKMQDAAVRVERFVPPLPPDLEPTSFVKCISLLCIYFFYRYNRRASEFRLALRFSFPVIMILRYLSAKHFWIPVPFSWVLSYTDALLPHTRPRNLNDLANTFLSLMAFVVLHSKKIRSYLPKTVRRSVLFRTFRGGLVPAYLTVRCLVHIAKQGPSARSSPINTRPSSPSRGVIQDKQEQKTSGGSPDS